MRNTATAEGDNDSDEDTEPGVDEVEDRTDDPDPSLNVAKTTTSTPANGETYALGEEIRYQIVVTNDGNLTITDITVRDELTGNTWTIESLAPEASQTYTARYTVTEADILAGSVRNTATADGDNESDEDTDPGVDEVEDRTDEPDPSLSVAKTTTSTPANGETYALGEEISYRIVVTNDGNVTISGITVTDELTGITGDSAWTIDSLAPGASREFTTSYMVTEADILAGGVTNAATATGTDPEDEDTDGSDRVTDDLEGMHRLTVNYWYSAVGGTVAADPFTNLYNTGAAYNVASPVIPGYTVSSERETGTMGAADITLNVVYTANEYTLTINYIFQNGAEAAPTYQDTLDYDEAYNVTSPVIEGYTASTAVYTGNMPARNVIFTVIYLPEIETPLGETVIDEYDTPLGLDVSSQSVGEMYE